ncbi:MAG: CvpA family protein [Kiritimatiellia bacterium]
MPFELTILDWALCGALALLAAIGLFRGLSGELGSLAGLAAGLAVGWVLYGTARGCAAALGFAAPGLATPTAAVIDFCFGLVAFGLVRWAVARFVSFCLGRVANAFFGLLSGLFKGAALVGVLTGVGIMTPGTYSEGVLAGHSGVIRTIAAWADAYAAGAAR